MDQNFLEHDRSLRTSPGLEGERLSGIRRRRTGGETQWTSPLGVRIVVRMGSSHRPVVVHAHTVPPNFIPEFFENKFGTMDTLTP